MENFKAPNLEDLQAYCALIHYLSQVESHLNNINEAIERSNELLKEQGELIEENAGALQYLSLDLKDSMEDAEHLFRVLKESYAATGDLAHRTMKKEGE